MAYRTAFGVAVIRAVRAAMRPEMALLVRVSQDKSPDGSVRLATSPDEMEGWLRPLVEAGADILHCSGLRYWRAEFDGSDLNFAGWAKKLTGAPTITVGSVGLESPGMGSVETGISVAPIDDVRRRLERGDFDLVAVGRPLIADPEWARKIRDDRHNELIGFALGAMKSLV